MKKILITTGGTGGHVIPAKIIEEHGYSEINLNIGCPSTKVIKGDFGACLMNSPELVSEFIYEIKLSSSLPVSIKTRLGLGYEHNLNLLYNLRTYTFRLSYFKNSSFSVRFNSAIIPRTNILFVYNRS